MVVPLNKLTAIKFDRQGEQTKAIFAFANGDIVTGQLELTQLALQTKWGKAEIDADAILEISANPKGEFIVNSSSGGWLFRVRQTMNQNNPGFGRSQSQGNQLLPAIKTNAPFRSGNRLPNTNLNQIPPISPNSPPRPSRNNGFDRSN